MQRAFIVNAEIDPSVDPESIRSDIETALSDTLYLENLTVTIWSEHGATQQSPAPLTFPPL
jgi:hypothetical protein